MSIQSMLFKSSKITPSIGRAYKRQSTEVIRICRVISAEETGIPRHSQQEKSFYDLVCAVEAVLECAANQSGKNIEESLENKFDNVANALKTHLEKFHTQTKNQPPIKGVYNATDLLKKARKTDVAHMRVSTRLAERFTSRLEALYSSPPKDIIHGFVRFASPNVPLFYANTGEGSISIPYTIDRSSKTKLPELLWVLRRIIKDRQEVDVENLHFYLAPDFTNQTKLEPLHDNDARPWDPILWGLGDRRTGRLMIECGGVSRIYGNIRRTIDNRVVLKDLHGVLTVNYNSQVNDNAQRSPQSGSLNILKFSCWTKNGFVENPLISTLDEVVSFVLDGVNPKKVLFPKEYPAMPPHESSSYYSPAASSYGISGHTGATPLNTHAIPPTNNDALVPGMSCPPHSGTRSTRSSTSSSDYFDASPGPTVMAPISNPYPRDDTPTMVASMNSPSTTPQASPSQNPSERGISSPDNTTSTGTTNSESSPHPRAEPSSFSQEFVEPQAPLSPRLPRASETPAVVQAVAASTRRGILQRYLIDPLSRLAAREGGADQKTNRQPVPARRGRWPW